MATIVIEFELCVLVTGPDMQQVGRLSFKREARPRIMGKKKKGKSSRAAVDLEEAKEEMVALDSIYAEAFTPLESGKGFSMLIVPHPGEAAANFNSVELQVKCATPPLLLGNFL